MKLNVRCAICAALSLAGADSAFAQGIVSDGAASYEFLNNAGTPGLANFSAGGVHGDELAWSWWWYRVSTDAAPRERRLNPTPRNQVYTGSSAMLSDTELLGLQWTMTQTVVAGAAPGFATLVSTLRVINTGVVPVTLDMFNITNPDLGGGLAGDAAVLRGPGLIGITDSFSDATGFVSFDPAAVSAYTVAGPASLSALLENNTVDNFVTGGLPFNAITDLGVGLQFTPVNLGVGGSSTFSFSYGIGVVPAPGVAGVLLTAALLAPRRRQRR